MNVNIDFNVAKTVLAFGVAIGIGWLCKKLSPEQATVVLATAASTAGPYADLSAARQGARS